jgi:tetratricopeptide (TPR) repeat protein
MRYKDNPTDINRIARELGANYVLDGSVRRSNNRVRIAVQLVEVSDHGHLWADSYDRELSDILDLQAEVAKAVTEQTSVRVSAGAVERLSNIRPVVPEAYEAYLRGRLLWNQRSASSIMRAVGLFERAIAIDPGYAPAHAGLIDCYAMLSAMAMGAASPAEMIPKAKAAARRALELDPQLAEAHASLGCIELFFDWDWTAAQASFERALKLNPDYPPGRQWYAEYLATLGRGPEAIAELARAQEVDPLSLTIPEALAAMHYYERDFDRAIYYSQRTLDADPNFALAYLNMGRAYVQKRMYRQAIATLTDARELFPDSTAVLMTLGHAYGTAGKKAEAQGIVNRLRSIARRRYVPAFHFAAIYTALGDYGQAFAWLTKARNERCDYMVYLDREPGADPLRADPRFRTLIPQPPAN